MHVNDLRPVPGSIHKKKRLGRGNASGQGTYSGRGIKGQQSRSGRDLRIGFEGGQIPLVRALSRKKGFTNRFREEYEAINVSVLASLSAGSSVTPDSLRQAGIVKSGRLPVKILGGGEIEVALTVEADRFSGSGRAKIEAAGGTAVELRPRVVKEARVAKSKAPKQEEPEEAPAAAATQEQAEQDAPLGEESED